MASSDTLLGFADFFADEIGAAPGPKKPPPPKKPTVFSKGSAKGGGAPTPGTKTLYGKAAATKPNVTVKQHGQVLASSKVTAQKAVSAATKALKAAAPKKTPKIVTKGLSAAKKTAIGATIAAAKSGAKPLNAKQKAALAKQTAAVKKAATAAKAAGAAGRNAKAAAIKLAQSMKKQKATSVALRKPKGATRIKGLDFIGNFEIGSLDDSDLYTILGAAPDPNNPGYLDDGSEDPAFWGEDPTGGADPFADPGLTDPFAGLGPDAPMDTGAELPPAPPMDHYIASYEAVGGIPYDESKGRPIGFCGSLNYFSGKTITDPSGGEKAFRIFMTALNPLAWADYGADNFGYVFGGNKGDSQWPGEDPNQWIEVHGHKGGRNWWENVGDWTATSAVVSASMSKKSPGGVAYGPIVGNPAMPDFAKMRVDGKGVCFWMPQEAPEWLTFPLKQAAALTAQAEAKAAAEAAKADAAAMAKIQADNALAQAQQDAANALAESQASSEQAIAQAAQETAASQLLLDQGKQEQEQRATDAAAAAEERRFAMEQARFEQEQMRADMEQARQMQAAEMEQQRQMQQLMLEQAKAEQEYLAQNPELAYGPQGGGGDEGGYPMPGQGGGIVPDYSAMEQGGYGGEGFEEFGDYGGVLPEDGSGFFEGEEI